MQGQVREDVYFQQTDLQARTCSWTGGTLHVFVCMSMQPPQSCPLRKQWHSRVL